MEKSNKIDKSILLFSKDNYECHKVGSYLQEHFTTVKFIKAEWGEMFPSAWFYNHYNDFDIDYIISYLYPCIIPKTVLSLAKEHAINFHPAPPKYPGIGGYNFAIWNGDKDYGVMVHEMDEKVDSGTIYDVISFSISKEETVKSLKEKSMDYLFLLFKGIVNDIKENYSIRHNNGLWKWHTPLYTRADFQKACEINILDYINQVSYDCELELDSEDLERHIRAFYFSGARDGPYFMINGKRYLVIPEDE